MHLPGALVGTDIGSTVTDDQNARMRTETADEGQGADELLDVVDPAGAYVASLPRSMVHADGLWHQVFHCLVVRSRPPARVLLQRRRSTARAFPHLLDVSVAGHLIAGEEPLAGVREIREELGLVVDPTRLVRLGRRLLVDDAGEGRNREIAHVYLLTDDTPLSELRLDPSEVDGFAEVAVADLARLLADPLAAITVREIDVVGVTRDTTCTAADLVPDVDSYWKVLAVMAERFVAGQEPLGI